MKKQTFYNAAVLAFVFASALLSCKKQYEIPDYDPGEVEVKPSPSVNMLKYRPEKYNMWDNWCIVKDETVHLFHLQHLRDDITYQKPVDLRGFGHATSQNLLRWNEKAEILSLYDKKLPNEESFRYTGSTVEYNGKYYLFYTMRKWAVQRIGLAISDDLYTWKEYEANPVLVPDGRWFITFNADQSGSNHPVWKDIVDCRDMVVVKDNAGSGFYGYFVTSADRPRLGSPTSVIGVAYSNDLIHWEQTGIAYAPTGVAMPEMVDIYEHAGSWYMTLTSGKNNGSLTAFSDPYVSRGMIYAKASSPKGPFVEDVNDNLMLGGSINSGYSMRSVVFKGKRRVMYVDVNNGPSVLSLPKNVGLNSDGHLRLLYADDMLPELRLRSIEPSIAGQPDNTFGWWPSHGGLWRKDGAQFICTTAVNSWQPMVFSGAAKNIEMNFTVKSSSCSSFGIVLGENVASVKLNNLQHILVIEPEKNRLYLTNSLWDFKNARSYKFEAGKEYKFRMILVGDTVELYINDELVFNSGIINAGNYLPGLFANNGNLTVSDVNIFELQQ